jgi:hypothetical protein
VAEIASLSPWLDWPGRRQNSSANQQNLLGAESYVGSIWRLAQIKPKETTPRRRESRTAIQRQRFTGAIRHRVFLIAGVQDD